MKSYIIEAYTIPESWIRILDLCLREGREYTIERGSDVGHKRKEIDCVVIHIKMPWIRPLTARVDGIEYAPSEQDIYNYYYNYVLDIGLRKLEDYDYTYGERIKEQLGDILHMLAFTPNTNQAIIRITKPEDIRLSHPPCMCLLQFKVINNKLVCYTYFRSWDAFNGYPYNVPAIQLLKEDILTQVNKLRQDEGKEPFLDGDIICFSSGLHLYDYEIEQAKEIVQKTLYKRR